MKQRAFTISTVPFVLRPRFWLSLALMLGWLTLAQAYAGYVPDENHNPVWAGADAEPAGGPDWNDDEGDSVPNWMEDYFATATWIADTDSDGLSDWDEIFGTGTNPILWDTNGNGLSDADDLIQPPDAGDMPTGESAADDFDGDGLLDLWELANGLNPNDAGDFADDPDGDFILNIEEYQHGTNPQVADDFTSVMGYSINTSTLSRQNDGTERDADWDGDGSTNASEIADGTDPREVLSQNGLPPDPELPFIEDQPPTTNEQDQPPANVQTGSQANDSDTGSWSVLSESVVIDSEDYVRDETRWGAWTEMVAFSTPGIGGNYIGIRIMKRVGWTGSLYKVTSHKVIRTINSKTGEVKESTLDPTVNEEFRGMAPVSEEDIDFIWGPNENQPGTSAD